MCASRRAPRISRANTGDLHQPTPHVSFVWGTGTTIRGTSANTTTATRSRSAPSSRAGRTACAPWNGCASTRLHTMLPAIPRTESGTPALLRHFVPCMLRTEPRAHQNVGIPRERFCSRSHCACCSSRDGRPSGRRVGTLAPFRVRRRAATIITESCVADAVTPDDVQIWRAQRGDAR